MNLVANEFRIKNGLIIGSLSVDSGGTITAGTWEATDIAVAHGGTGVSTLTDGGILLGNGTGAIQAMAVLADGEMIVGDGTTDPVAESGATLRTSIGVGTGDSPQFTGIELGHANDTTIARASAGQITVEGTAVVLAGGANHDGFSDFVANEHIDHSGVSISAGSGLTGGGTIAANRTLTVGAGNGITVNTNDVAVTAAQTTITSVLNASLVVGRDAHNQIQFSTDNEIHFKTNNETPVIKMKASGEIEATKFDGALEGNADTATALATARAINGVNFDGTGDITVTAAGSTLSDTVTVAKGGTGATTLTDGGILLGSGTGAITAMAVLADGAMIVGDGTTDPVAESGATLRTSIGVGTGDSPQFTAIELGHASDTTIARASAGVISVEGETVITTGNLKSTLAAGFGSNAVTIGDANDVVTIGNDLTVTGDLLVSGDTVTVDTATLVVEDPLIKLAKGNAADTVDVGIYAQYTESSTTKYAGIIRDASVTGDPWTFFDSLTTEPTTTATVGSNNFDFADVKAGGITAVDGFTGNVTGNADTASSASTVGVTPNNAAGSFVDENNLIMFLPDGDSSTGTGNYRPESSAAFHYNPSTTILTVPKITSTLTGNVTGNASGSAGTVTSIGNLTGDVTSSNRATTIANNAVTLAKMAGLARGKIIYGDSNGDPAALALGSNGQVLTTDGTDISWGDASGGIASLADDSSPQLGGDLDTNGSEIVSTSNQHISITPHGTGDIQLNADTIRVGDSNADVTIAPNISSTTAKLQFQSDGDTLLRTASGTGDMYLNANSLMSMQASTFRLGTSGGNPTVTTLGTSDLTLNTNSGTNSGSIVIADGANANITLAPNGTGLVDIPTALEVGTGTQPLSANGVVTIINDDSDTTKTLLLVDNESDATNGPVLTLYRNTASPAVDDILGKIELNGEDVGGNPRAYGSIRQESTTVGNGTHDGTMFLNVAIGGTQTDVVSVDGTGGYGGLTHNPSGIKTLGNIVSATSTANNNYITLLEVPHATFKAVKASIHITDSSSNEVQTQETIAHYDGSNANYSNYGIIFDGAAAIGAIEVDINSSNIRIRFKNTQGATRDIAGSIHAVCHP